MLIRFGEFELDEGRFLLRRGSRRIDLRPKVFDLLLHLIRKRDRVVLRDELVQDLWGHTTVGLGSLSGLVNELRQALGESGRGISSIRTVHARGYQFVAEIEDVEDAIRPLLETPLPARLADAVMAHVRDGGADVESITNWLRTQQARSQTDQGADSALRRMKKVEPGGKLDRAVFGGS